jgi:hypothetical protein
MNGPGAAGGRLDEGLSPLDEERAGSMASEGGRSAQAYEAGEPLPVARPRGARGAWRWWIALSLGAVAGFYGYRRLRRAL